MLIALADTVVLTTGPETDPVPLEVLRNAWADARDDAHDAYRDWCDAPRGERSDAYAVYRAAEEREAVAAELLSDGVAAVAALVGA
jgi:hypothetical protein